jgi:hypothetical protein
MASLIGIVAAKSFSASEFAHELLASWQGYAVLIEQPHRRIRLHAPGDISRQHVSLKNISGHALRIVGGTSGCECATSESLPRTLTAGQRDVIEYVFDSSGRKMGERYVVRPTIYVDRPTLPLTMEFEFEISPSD